MKYFYISTIGGSASTWLTSILNTHEDIFSVHGTRSIPPSPSGNGDIPPAEFFRLLSRYKELMKPSATVLGGIHGYYGVSALDEVKKLNGTFLGVIRHPIKRIHSLFSHNINNFYLVGKNDVYSHIVNAKLNINIDRFIKPKVGLKRKIKSLMARNTDQVELRIEGKTVFLTGIEKMFFDLCHNIINDDLILTNHVYSKNIYKMEHLVSERKYCLAMFEKITQSTIDLNTPQFISSLDSQFKKTLNKHTNSEHQIMELYQLWPDSFKFIYQSVLRHFGGDRIVNMYRDTYGYDIPLLIDHNFIVEKGKITALRNVIKLKYAADVEQKIIV